MESSIRQMRSAELPISQHGLELRRLDACAFGMAPVFVLHSLSVQSGGLATAVWWASAFAYLGAVVTRLAFYNVEGDDARFVGLPTPAVALVWATYLLSPSPSPPWVVPLLFVACGLSMVSPIAIPRPRMVGLALFSRWAATLVVWHLT